jgi:glutamate-5-semialdehyde dehydrogenase
MTSLTTLTPGQIIPYGGDKVALVDEALAKAFQPGDRLIVVQETGDLLRVPAATHALASDAVRWAADAFQDLGRLPDDAITAFFDAFAAHLADDGVWAKIAAANAADVDRAAAKGRSTTRLVANAAMRADMVAGLRQWRDSPSRRERIVDQVSHDGWSIEQVTAPLGVVGFVFEGRPNVFADATGVLRTGNTVVFRIGSDALGTARAIVEHALDPALRQAGLPAGSASLIDSAEHAAGHAMFSDTRLALAVARGSGAAVAQLGAVARQAGTPVSLHGTGGAWLVVDETAEIERFKAVVTASLDRKVCNTLNVCCIPEGRAHTLVPAFLEAITAAGARLGQPVKLHVVEGDERHVPLSWFDTRITVARPAGPAEELQAELISEADLATEWEWEATPEVSLKIIRNTDNAIDLFNQYSPQFVASLISEDASAHQRFYRSINAAFVGDGFTRWVDGQYALGKPELGLSNWQHGRLFARGGVLAGDGVFTVRTRMRQTDPTVRR